MTASFSVVDVVREGVCVGCGACRVATGGAIRMAVNRHGAYEADLAGASEQALAQADRVCPFSDRADNETAIAADLFDGTGRHADGVGHHLSVTSGYVAERETRLRGSSGGLTSWLTIELFERGLVDGVIHVGRDPDGAPDRMFAYCVSETRDALAGRRKSQYYAATFAEALLSVRGNGRRYAIVGVPCCIKAARLVAQQDAVLSGQLGYFIALVCGHLKTPAFAELMAWQVGVPPGELELVDFRLKAEHRIASAYSFGARRRGEAHWQARTANELVGGSWGHALFQLKACDYCDDIFGETADVCFGDAWLPQYEADWLGTNVTVCRHPAIEAILRDGARRGTIHLEPLSPALALESQAGNVRHRWDGLSVRLADAQRQGHPVPRKRIAPGSRPVPFLRRRLIRLRQVMAARSHEAFLQARAAGSLEPFLRQMLPLMRRMDRQYRYMALARPSRLLTALARRMGRIARKLLRRPAAAWS